MLFYRINSSVVGPDTSLFNPPRTEEETSPMLHANDGAGLWWLPRACQATLVQKIATLT